ncbi:sugar transferase [Nocardioides sp.]|uniref:sugar transferase n=1 Tax=Nocardioides sp. TaxID=35761 RepID=UPI0026362832|nr:sugar transferase [Nocardioides sp.]
MTEQRGPGATTPEQVLPLIVRPDPVVGEPDWRERYARSRAWVDLIVLLGSGAITLAVAWALPRGVGPGAQLWQYVHITFGLVAWSLLTQRMVKVYDRKSMLEGPEEYQRLLRAVVLAFAGISVVGALTAFSLSRFFLLTFFSLSTLGMLGTRKLARTRLVKARVADVGALNRVLVIGGARSARQLAAAFGRHVEDGYRVTGVWWPDTYAHFGPEIDVAGERLPSYDSTHTLAVAIAGARADTVIVTDTELLGNVGLKALGWALEGTGIDLLVSPNVVDLAGPRIHVRPVANLPLIHLDEPQYIGASRFEKEALDKVIAVGALIVFSPLMLAIALAIKITDRGPVFYRSERVGVGGATFRMWKFRTMVTGADQLREDLTSDVAGEDQTVSPLFKMRADPRVTRVGHLLRRYSLDELPQLFNVLAGQMSIVGPRPPLPAEVAAWEGGVERRLLVKQGMTGLWQVSGRSDLPWEETVRLDLDYVENWSIVRDLHIIWRTVRAVLSSDGAY